MFEQTDREDVFLAFIPLPVSSKVGPRFVRKDPNDFQLDLGIKYILSFEMSEDAHVTAACLPKLFEWREDGFMWNGKPVDHFRDWNTKLKVKTVTGAPKAVLEVVSFETSPKKVHRVLTGGAAYVAASRPQASSAVLDLLDA